MIPMNFMKSKAGFTLVELIVVIAILGILAGIAVPAYSGYITKANQAADITICDAVKTAVFAAYAEEGSAPPTSIAVADDSVKIGGSEIDGAYKTNFELYYGGAVTSIDVDHSGTITWNGDEWAFS